MIDSSAVDHLLDIAGVRPSSSWIHECRRYLRSGANQSLQDDLLSQIMHHDLRDVVRESDQTTMVHAGAQKLRLEVKKQLSSSASQKATLPSSFRLLVQIEEIVDVARNTETRLSAVADVGLGKPGSFANRQNRCLKVCLSDGYCSDDSTNVVATNESPEVPLVAMEVSPIPNLLASSPAGTKILLRGPIDIRFGLLMCHQGNTLVLGGYVKHLVEIQRAALEAAKKSSGVGVDPTVRALIWNPDNGEEKEGQDEGEAASTDVSVTADRALTVVPIPPTEEARRVSLQNASRVQHTSRDHRRSVAAVSNTHERFSESITTREPQSLQGSYNTALHVNHSTTRLPGPFVLANNVNESLPARMSEGNIQGASAENTAVVPTPFNSLNDRSSMQVRPISVEETSTNLCRTRNGQSSLHSNVPVAGIVQRTDINSSSNGTERSNNGSHRARSLRDVSNQNMSTTAPKKTVVNPYQSRIQSRKVQEVSLNEPRMDRTETVPESRRNDISQPIEQPPPACGNIRYSMAPAAEKFAIAETLEDSSSLRQTLSFESLLNLLKSLLHDRARYQQYYGKILVVPMRQVGCHFHFNTVRKKHCSKEDKQQGKNVEFVYFARFGGSNGNDSLISCNIDSKILEPFFSSSPAELRKMSKNGEREKSDKITAEGGAKLTTAFLGLSVWEVTLRLVQEEQPTEVDGMIPVLQLLSRKTP